MGLSELLEFCREPHRQKIRSFLRSVARDIGAGTIVLDLGAGETPYRGLFRHTNYIATDMRKGTGISFISDANRIPMRKCCCHVVLCTELLEHVPNPEMLLGEMLRVLEPGGRLVLTAPLCWRQHMKPYDFFRFTRFGLEELFRRAGFEVNSIEPLGGYFVNLALQLHQLPDTVLPPERTLFRRIVKFPFYRALALVFHWFLAPLCYSLDFLDRRGDQTVGHACICTKPGSRLVPEPAQKGKNP